MQTTQTSAAAAVGAPKRRHRLIRSLGHRWPSLLALGLVAVSVGDGQAPPTETLAIIVLILPTAYLVFGAVGRELRPRRVLVMQLAAAAFYLLLVAAVLMLDGDAARLLLAVGWIAHAFWDGAHFHADRVVPRPWAEWCGVFDIGIGIAVLASL